MAWFVYAPPLPMLATIDLHQDSSPAKSPG